ncbi:MAG: 4'-phosphopantetheinyl transferase superfamily protein [Actinoplanes sp.]
MIEALLPAGVIAVEAFDDRPGEPAFPGEEDLIANAVPGRRAEFVTARRCAREALAALGYPAAAIRAGSRREPLWPSGVAGSITHCAGYRAAAVAHAADIPSLGIDAEPHAPLPAGVERQVIVAAEATMLARLARTHPGTHWDRLLFSAKESIYKTWFPLTGRWLGFEEATLSIDPDAQTFSARITADASPLAGFDGRYRVGDGLIVTTVWQPPAGSVRTAPATAGG